MKTVHRILSFFLTLAILSGLLPGGALAAREWAYVRFADGTTRTYDTFPAAWEAAVAANNAAVGLLANWEGGLFTVPEDKQVTLELNGYVLTRNRSSSEGDGEVLLVEKNGLLAVYGGTQAEPAYRSDATHRVWVYVANADRYGYTRRQETLKGGIINGGNSSTTGGGIHMLESAKVYLYHVTVAGNYADNRLASYGDGGGVHVDAAYCHIEMLRSHIDHNVADDNGGGLYIEGDDFSLRGDAKQTRDPEAFVSENAIPDWTGPYNYFPPDAIGSSVSYNCVYDSEDGGGGIYMDNETGLLEGINFLGNIATDDSDDGDGGGVYLDEEEITLRDCNILRNKADELGAGSMSGGTTTSWTRTTTPWTAAPCGRTWPGIGGRRGRRLRVPVLRPERLRPADRAGQRLGQLRQRQPLSLLRRRRRPRLPAPLSEPGGGRPRPAEQRRGRRPQQPDLPGRRHL